MDWFEKHAMPGANKHLNLVGFWYADSGELNQVVHLWAWEDLNQRARQFEEFVKDPHLDGAIPQAQEMYVRQESKFLSPASFSPLK